jgi:hypothetical protein
MIRISMERDDRHVHDSQDDGPVSPSFAAEVTVTFLKNVHPPYRTGRELRNIVII